ncbi:MAG: ACT domain-containing protein [Clostridia bacterium]|nr:ACT domain-containing protein [Clostridia bacterium]
MDRSKYIIIHVDALPEVYIKVLDAKKLVKDGTVNGVTEAAKQVGISRSTYYKYCDYVFSLSESDIGKKVTISMLLYHESGVLSNLLEFIAKNNCNILTISQDSPIDHVANVSITFDISSITGTFSDMLEEMKTQKGVKKLDLIAME